MKQIVVVALVFLAILVALLMGVGVGYLVFHRTPASQAVKSITSFEECAAAGYPVTQSFPETCVVAGGQTFTNQVPQTSEPGQGGNTPVVQPPAVDTVSDLALIKQALVAKDHLDLTDVTVTLAKDTGQYASGAVNGSGGGGYYFAAKTGNTWVIVASGNGSIMCSDLVNYPDFPSSMIPECLDAAFNQVLR